ncbi:hypothetical protein GCM10008941_28590 [Rhizomicrobium palustre]
MGARSSTNAAKFLAKISRYQPLTAKNADWNVKKCIFAIKGAVASPVLSAPATAQVVLLDF